MLKLAIRIEESDKQIKHSIQHKNAIKYIKQTQKSFINLTVKTDNEKNKDNVHDEDNQREIVPNHLPVVVGVDNEPGNGHLLLFIILLDLTFLLLIDIFEDLVSSNIIHHSYNFYITSYKLPLIFSPLNFLLFLRVLLQ